MDEPTKTTADATLAAECEALIREPGKGRIWAIKRVREVRRIPLNEAMTWVQALNIEPATPFELRERARELRHQAADLLHQAAQYEATAERFSP